MKHPSNQTLFAHWQKQRGRRSQPERSDIDPAAIRGALGDTFILAFDSSQGHPARLAGTRVCALVGGALKSRPFIELWNDRQHYEIGRLVGLIGEESVGVVAGASASSADGQPLELELLLLPLAHWGRKGVRVLGALAPLNTPSWFGTRPIGPLALGDYRYVGLRADPPIFAGKARVRHGFVIYDGGQAKSLAAE